MENRKIFKVILPIKLNKPFFYLGDDNMLPGDIVLVPFGRNINIALIWEEAGTIDFPVEKLKPIKEILISQLYNKSYRNFLLYFASYNLTTIGQVLRLILPNIKILSYKPKFITYLLGNQTIRMTSNRKKIKAIYQSNNLMEISESELLLKSCLTKNYLQEQVKKGFLLKQNKEIILDNVQICYNEPVFSDAQKMVVNDIQKFLTKKKFKVGFLNGVTGAGKTEIYFAVIAQILQTTKQQVLVLLPEILLTKQFIDKFYKRFGFIPEIWHSKASLSDKKKIWHKVITGNIRFLVGARSALFLPFKNLGLIILDEEHETSYKQEDNLVYHARDMAIARSYKEGFPILLVSATPSLETKVNIKIGKYQEFCLQQRYGVASLPEICLIDMKKEVIKSGKSLSEQMQQEIRSCLEKKEQVLIFLNRRGYAPLNICKSCGYRYKCDNCDVAMVEHRASNRLLCHHCGSMKVLIKDCPKCHSKDSLVAYGIGLERTKEELLEYFPNSKIAMITSDESKDLDKLTQIFQDIEENKYDIIIGTQIISKGHHFANLTLACVIDGDIGNEVQDLRCTEKMFQMLHQISGRVGREEKKGKALIQTYNPQSNFLQTLISGNIEEFYNYEMAKRKKFLLPPFSQFVALIISGQDKSQAHKVAMDLAKLFSQQAGIVLYGPAPAPLFFLRNKFRYRILLKFPRENYKVGTIIRHYYNQIMNLKTNIKIDVDPQNFV